MSLSTALKKSNSRGAIPRPSAPQLGQWLRVVGLVGVVPLMMACGGGGSNPDGSDGPLPVAVPLETGAGTIQGYNDYSFDKNTVLGLLPVSQTPHVSSKLNDAKSQEYKIE